MNGWKKRREDAGPKTIEQIHKEIEKEQLAQKLAHMAPMGPPPNRRDDRGNRNDRNDDRRRSQKGGPGGKNVVLHLEIIGGLFHLERLGHVIEFHSKLYKLFLWLLLPALFHEMKLLIYIMLIICRERGC